MHKMEIKASHFVKKIHVIEREEKYAFANIYVCFYKWAQDSRLNF